MSQLQKEQYRIVMHIFLPELQKKTLMNVSHMIKNGKI